MKLTIKSKRLGEITFSRPGNIIFFWIQMDILGRWASKFAMAANCQGTQYRVMDVHMSSLSEYVKNG